MAITEVGAGSQLNSVSQGAQSTTGTLAYVNNVGSGNLLIAAGSVFNAGVTITGVTDTRGTSYTVIQDSGSANHCRFIAYGIAPSAGACTITVTTSANAYISFGIDEFTGVDATPLSVNGGSSTGTSTAPSDSITTLTAGELIIGCLGVDIGSGTVTITSNNTEIGQEGNANNFETYGASFQIAGAAGAYSQSWTLSASQTWRVLTASFEAAGGGGAQTLTDTLFTNTNSFFTDTIVPGTATLTDTLFTNTNTFFSDTIVGGAVATAFQADAFQNDAFQIEAGGSPQTLTDTLFTNSNTFFSDTIVPGTRTLVDSLFTNTNTFFADIINQAGGPQTLVDSLYTNTNTFFADTIAPGSRTLVDSLFTNTNAFFSDTIVNSSGAIMVQWESSVDPNVTGYFVYWDTVSHAGGVYTDYAFSADVSGNAADQYLITGLTVGQTYFINISSHGAGGHDANESALWGEISDTAADLATWQFLIDGLRYENPNTFFSDTITQPGGNQTLTDTLFTNTNTFFSDTIVPGARTLVDSLFTNTNTFFADTIQPGTVTLSDTLFTNTNTFFSDTINQAGGAQTLVDSLFTNNNTFFADTIEPGSVTLNDSLFTNTNQFFSDTITQGAPNQTLVDSLFTNTNQFFSDTVVVGDAVLIDSLFVNTNQFFNDIIIGGAQPVIVIDTKGYDVPYKKEKDRKKELRKRIERIIDEYETINNISLPIVEKQEIIKQADNKLLTSNKQIVNYNETINDLLSNIEMQILFLVEKQKEEQEDDDDLLLLS